MRLHYEIKGMNCAACVAHVERAVRSVLSREDVFSVSLLTNSVSLLVSDTSNTQQLEERLKAAVFRAGYELITEQKKEERCPKSFFGEWGKWMFSAFFTVSLMYLSMGGMLGLELPPFLSGKENAFWLGAAQLLLTVPVLILNFHFFSSGFRALFHLSPNMDSLVAIGASASVLYGLFAVWMLFWGNEATVHQYLHDLYFESAAMILTLVSLGKHLEAGAKIKTSDAIRSLATLTPKFVTVIKDGEERSVPADALLEGDLVLLRAGEWIGIDGVVVSGEGSVDESALTGESMPVEKTNGSKIRAACVLLSGALTVKAEAVGENTSLSHIIRLLEDAAASKAPISRIADRVSAVFVPCVIGISMLSFGAWMLFSRQLSEALRAAVAVLVISCPCALGLATPTAITVGVGRGASRGILFRSAEALEKLCGVKTVVFDKTGTLTEGKPTVTDFFAYGEEKTRMLMLAASVEHLSSHPLSFAVERAAEEAGILQYANVRHFATLTGVGAEGEIDGAVCRVGKPEPSACEEPGEWQKDFFALENDGKTAVLVTLDKRPIGVIGFSDRIREEARAAVEKFKEHGVVCRMLTGDQEKTASLVAKKVGLDGFSAGLLPEEKERIVKALSLSAPCAMVGDGINDAPALVSADVGIAVGAGTEVAMDCAGVVLSGSSLMGVADAYALSCLTVRIIRQNLFWALFYNVICIPVAAGVFYPLLGWQLSPMLASLAMSCSSICVVSNALRLRSIPLRKGEKKMIFGKKESITYTLSVDGMMCQRCVAHVKSALEGVKGVLSADVDLETKKAVVTARSAVSADQLVTAVTAAGYETKVE